MFLKEIDWSNPRFAPWDLSNLGQLNEEQVNALFDDDEIDFPDFTEAELIDIVQKFPCRVDLSLNLCKYVERSWAKQMYKQADFASLMPYQKRNITRKMVQNADSLYNKYFDANRLKRRIRRRTNRVLAPYYEERFLKRRFNRIKSLGIPQPENITSIDSESSLVTVINTGNDNRSRQQTNDPNQDANDDDYREEIEKESQIMNNHSNDEHMSANKEKLSKKQNHNKELTSINTRNRRKVQSNTSSPFVTPRKEPHEKVSITPALERFRKLRRNFVRIDSDDNGAISIEQTIEMFSEIGNNGIIVQNDDSSMESYQRFNDPMTESLEGSDAIGNEEEPNIWISTPRASPSEFVQTCSFDVINSVQDSEGSSDQFLSTRIRHIRTSPRIRARKSIHQL